MSDLVENYNKSIDAVYAELRKCVVKEEYCVGSDMSRGYYCPSLIQDIVVGDCHRGRILKRLTKRSDPTHKYGFDKNNKLIIIDELHTFGATEIILYEENTNIGISFYQDCEIGYISECKYKNGCIVSYIIADYTSSNKEISSYSREEYNYSPIGLETVDWYRYFIPPQDHADDDDFPLSISYLEVDMPHDMPILSHDKYKFQHDSEGCLSKYIAEQYNNGKLIENTWAGNNTYDVYLKRKV